MGSITKINRENGKIGYKVRISKNGNHISRTFSEEDDAKLFIYYREKLIEQMKNFDLPLHERLTLSQIFELKIEKTELLDSKSISDMKLSLSRLDTIFGEHRCYSDISMQEWTEAVKKLLSLKVYMGAKTKNGERDISYKSVKKILAHASSSVSFCQSMGFKLDNKPILVIQNTLTPMIHKKGIEND